MKEFTATEMPDGEIAFIATLPNRYSLHVMVDAFLSIKSEAGAPPAAHDITVPHTAAEARAAEQLDKALSELPSLNVKGADLSE